MLPMCVLSYSVIFIFPADSLYLIQCKCYIDICYVVLFRKDYKKNIYVCVCALYTHNYYNFKNICLFHGYRIHGFREPIQDSCKDRHA